MPRASNGRDPRGSSPDGERSIWRSPGRGRPPYSSSVYDDDVFEVLSNARRHEILKYLLDSDGTATVGELAEHIAANEHDTAVSELTSYQRKSVYVSMYQNHLPQMDKAGVIDYDENRKVVRLREKVTEFEPFLTDHPTPADARWRIVPVLALGAMVMLGTFQVGPLAMLSPVFWTSVGAAGLVGLTVGERYRHTATRRVAGKN